MKFAMLVEMTEHDDEEDASAVMSVYVLPDDFERPSDWEETDISVFAPSILGQTDPGFVAEMESKGSIFHGIPREGE